MPHSGEEAPHSTSVEGEPARTGPHPWRQQKPVIPRPLEAEHGILNGGQLVPSTREEMLERVRAGLIFPMAWSPESPRLVWPEELPWIFPEIRARLHRETRRRARPFAVALAAAVAAVIAGLLGWAPVAGIMAAAPVWPLFFGLLAAWTGAKLYEARRTARMTPEGFRAEVDDALHGTWLRSRPAPATRVLRFTFIGVGVVQALAASAGHDTVLAGGLVKAAVWQGEAWRLLSAGYLHLNVIHFAFNLGALLWLAQLVETHSNRYALPLVFLLTILSGTVASLLLSSAGIAVGASTGLMGLIGFLVVVGWRRRERVPAGLLRTILVNVAIVGAVGLVGSGIVDNAGHLGGLVGGLLLGLAITPPVRPDDAVGWTPAPALKAAGAASMAVLVAGAAATGLYLFAGPY
jgi:membrane associated rhomboid family serine protease